MAEKEIFEIARQHSGNFVNKVQERIQSEDIDNTAFPIIFGMLFIGLEKFKDPKMIEDVKKIIDIVCEESEKADIF